MARAELFPDVLRPGETRTFPMFFNSLDGTEFEFFASGSNSWSGLTIDPSAIQMHTTLVVATGFGPVLYVAGEFTNHTGADLNAPALSAHVDGALTARVDATPLGCGRLIAAGDTVPIAFAIPLGFSRSGDVIVEGIGGYHNVASYELTVKDVTMNRRTGRQWTVEAVVQNDSSFRVAPIGACLSFRDADGRVVGAASTGPSFVTLDPGESMTISADVLALAPPATAEAIVYGFPSLPR